MDYGKLAYLKAEDLDKRVSLLSSSTYQDKSTKLYFNLSDSKILTSSSNIIEEYFLLNGKTSLDLQFSGALTSEITQVIIIELVFNGAVLHRHNITVSNIPTSYSLGKIIKNVTSINNSLAIRFLVSYNATLNSSLIAVCGDNIVQYEKYKDIVYCDTNETISLLNSDLNVEIYYSNLNSSSLTLNTKQLKISKFRTIYFGQYLYIAYINNKGKLNIGLATNLGNKDLLINDNVTSFDFVKLSTNTALVFYVVLSRAYSCIVDISSGNITNINAITGLSSTDKVVEVTACTCKSGVAVVVECKGKTLLIVDKGKGYEIERNISVNNVSLVTATNDNISIYSVSNKLASRLNLTVGTSATPVTSPLRYCDKLIPLKSKLLVLDLGKITIE